MEIDAVVVKLRLGFIVCLQKQSCETFPPPHLFFLPPLLLISPFFFFRFSSPLSSPLSSLLSSQHTQQKWN